MPARRRQRALRALRMQRDLTQMAMADRVGLPYTRYVRVELGYVQPTPAERQQIAKALRRSQRELFG